MADFPGAGYYYRAFGLTIASSLEIPELMPAPAGGIPDVTVSLGGVPDFPGVPTRIGARYQTGPGKFLYRIDNIAKYLVLGGSEVIIESYPGVEENSIRTFLLGSVFAALLQQRAMLPLHGSSIRVGDRCVVFSGLSGSGKSTTARAFIKRGYRLNADDVSVISINRGGIPVVYPEYPRLKLWRDVLKREGENPESYTRVRRVLEKFSVPAGEQFNHHALPLEKLYILTAYNKSNIAISPVRGMEKFNRLKRLTYRFKFAKGLETEVFHFKTAATVCRRIPFHLVERPIRPFLLEELADLLERDFGGNGKLK
jgi:hypothetical protein